MKLVERDLLIFRYLNLFGYSNTNLIKKLYFPDLKDKTSAHYRRFRLLENQGYLKSEKCAMFDSKVLFLTKQSIEILKGEGFETFPLYSRINYLFWRHDFWVQKVLQSFLEANYKSFLSERKIKSMPEINKGLIPDLIINTEHGSIAIEVEINQKEDGRLSKKLAKYSECSNYRGVLYLTRSTSLQTKFNNPEAFFNTKGLTLKAFDLDEFLLNPSNHIKKFISIIKDSRQ